MWLKQFGKVFSKPAYIFIAMSVAWLVFTFAVWLPNLRLISLILLSSTAPIIDKMRFLLSLYGSIGTNFSPVSASYTIAIAVLFGVNIALLVYYIRRVRGGKQGLRSTGALSIGGLISGTFGIGCAACGTFILTSVLTLFGVGGFLAYLPFGGEEFGFVGVGLLVYSIYRIMQKISKPLVCDNI